MAVVETIEDVKTADARQAFSFYLISPAVTRLFSSATGLTEDYLPLWQRQRVYVIVLYTKSIYC
jgi:hypothetical protein